MPPRDLVLVVDDEEPLVDMIAGMLEAAGFQSVSAMDGPSAVRTFEERRRDLCCILLDRNLPGMDGLEVYRAIRGVDPDLPVVFCSGIPEDEQVRAATGYRHVRYVTKPFRYAELVGALRDALDPHSPA